MLNAAAGIQPPVVGVELSAGKCEFSRKLEPCIFPEMAESCGVVLVQSMPESTRNRLAR